MTDAEKDAAWRSLPEGFKKEVSRHYKSWNNSLAFGSECAVLDYIFGKHNLTASEEPIQDKTMNTEELLKSRKERGKQTLNIGDKVRAISASGKPLYDGKIATIIEKGISSDEVYYGLYIEGVAVEKRSTPLIGKSEIIGNTSLLAPFFAEDLELVASRAEEEKLSFSKGDKVIYVGCNKDWIGSRFVIDGNIFYNDYFKCFMASSISCDDTHIGNVPLSDLAPYTEEQPKPKTIPIRTKHGTVTSPAKMQYDDGVWLAYHMELAKAAMVAVANNHDIDYLDVPDVVIGLIDGVVERLKGGTK